MTQAEYLALKDIAQAADIVGLGTFFETVNYIKILICSMLIIILWIFYHRICVLN